MSVLPRWDDPFTANPLINPAYQFDSGVTYDGGNTRVVLFDTFTLGTVAFRRLNSKNATGIVEVNLEFIGTGGSGKAWITCFGYTLAFAANSRAIFYENATLWRQLSGSTDGLVSGQFTIFGIERALSSTAIASGINGLHTFKFVATNVDVQIFIDAGLAYTLPPRDVVKDVEVGISRRVVQDSSSTMNLNSMLILSDSALSLEPTIVKPAAAGTVNSLTGPFIWRAAKSRLYLDLTAHAGLITGVSNVIYDPGGVALAMDEIVTGLESPKNDFYFESPALVGNVERLVIDEDFRVANGVLAGQTIQADLDGTGFINQVIMIKQEDDQEYVLEVDDSPILGANGLTQGSSLNGPSTQIQLINSNADGNLPLVSSLGGIAGLFNGDIVNVLTYSPGSLTFPVLIDLDLLFVRTLTRFGTLQDAIGVDRAVSFTVYSNTIPWAGPSLAQGTLEYATYPLFTTPITYGPLVNIKTRYLRFSLQASDFNLAGVGTTHIVANEIDIISSGYRKIESDVDNAQFAFSLDPGGAFNPFPGGGITQDSGRVRAFLPAGKELQEGISQFWRIRAKSDLTD